jgi:hypothetical protein
MTGCAGGPRLAQDPSHNRLAHWLWLGVLARIFRNLAKPSPDVNTRLIYRARGDRH